MPTKLNYNINMAHLWKNESRGGGYYAIWQDGKKRRKRALCMPGEKRATKDPKLAKKLLTKFNRELMAGKVVAITSGVKVTFFPFCDEFH